MVAEQTKRTERAAQLRTIATSSAGLPTDTAELGINPDHQARLAAGPPRLASTRTSTTTKMSTDINGIYMLSEPIAAKTTTTWTRASNHIRGQQLTQ
eukprot:5618028-Amphidinium_carterae.1